MKTLILTILSTLILSTPALADRNKLKYNYMEDRYEYAAPKDRIKYNAAEDEWTHESSGSRLRYNPCEDRFEYAE